MTFFIHWRRGILLGSLSIAIFSFGLVWSLGFDGEEVDKGLLARQAGTALVFQLLSSVHPRGTRALRSGRKTHQPDGNWWMTLE
jgi:hypothetical protein